MDEDDAIRLIEQVHMIASAVLRQAAVIEELKERIVALETSRHTDAIGDYLKYKD